MRRPWALLHLSCTQPLCAAELSTVPGAHSSALAELGWFYRSSGAGGRAEHRRPHDLRLAQKSRKTLGSGWMEVRLAGSEAS